MRNLHAIAAVIIFTITACTNSSQESNKPVEAKKVKSTSSYLDYSSTETEWTGGEKMIPIETPSGTFNVYTKRMGNNPDMKLLLLHGGPGATHEYFTPSDSYLPKEGIEYYYYDQLESAYSDQPNDSSLWTLDRYVDEVEQVRTALGLDASNFYLLGHSWGGVLAMEYALKYPQNLKGVIVSNMVSSVPEYNKYAEEVLGPQLPPEVLLEVKELEAKEDYSNPRYNELLYQHYYTEHILRRPLDEWPDAVNRAFEKLNYGLYLTMQGPSEFGIIDAAKLSDWDVTDQLPNISTPTLMLAGKHDTMDPDYMKMMSEKVQKGRFHLCEEGSHMSMYDDQESYFEGLISFMKDVNNGDF